MQPFVPVLYPRPRGYIATAGLGAPASGSAFWKWLPWLLLGGWATWYLFAGKRREPSLAERHELDRVWDTGYDEGVDEGKRQCEREHGDREPGTMRSPRLLFGRDREELEGAKTERAPARVANRRRRNGRRAGRCR